MGFPPAVRQQAAERGLRVVDATCPLVSKVHREITRFARQGYHILYIGHRGHVEAIGSMGHAPTQTTLIEEAWRTRSRWRCQQTDPLPSPPRQPSVWTRVNAIVQVLRRRFPHIELPRKDDICYATTNRQAAGGKALAPAVGYGAGCRQSRASSNSNRLREVAESQGVPALPAFGASRSAARNGCNAYRVIGVTSGASTPESSTEAIVGELLRHSPHATVETLQLLEEHIEFIPPRTLIAQAEATESA
jgi:4-hydroxy-3-methylbut-2-enyl diphosphate reductase